MSVLTFVAGTRSVRVLICVARGDVLQRDVEVTGAGIVHAERLENPLFNDLRIGFSRHGLDDRSEHFVPRVAVLLPCARLESQR